MIRIFTLFFLLVLFVQAVFAQSHTLDLSKQSLPEIPRQFYISKVVDSRLVKSTVGEVQLGMLNKKANAVLKAPLEQELQQFITQHHPRQDNQTPVILRINSLRVSEETLLNTESATAEVLVDFILEDGSNYLKLYTLSETATQTGLDVTKKHEENIATVIASILKQFSYKDLDKLKSLAEVLTWEQVTSPFDGKVVASAYPVLTATSFPKGIYMTLDEFRNNTPGITANVDVKTRSTFETVMVGGSDILPVITTPEGKQKPVKDAWGFSDGQALYVRYLDAYYPAQLKNNVLVFLGPPVNSTANQAAIVTGAVLGGAIGGGIAGALVAANAKPAEYELDLTTGRVTHNGSLVNAGSIVANAKLILYREAKAERPELVTISLNGDTKTLGLNEIQEYELSATGPGTSVCIPGDDKACLNFIPKAGTTYYMVCSLNNKSGGDKPVIKTVDTATGEYALKGIKFAQEKEKKQHKQK